MKTIIENPIILPSTWTSKQKEDMHIQFSRIIRTITRSVDKMTLKYMIINNKAAYPDFKFEFGSNHMWVKQNINLEKRLILVEF